MTVKANAVYIYSPNLLDQIDGRTDLKDGEEVKVINLPGAPKCNTMHHAHVQRLDGTFAGLVHTNSLHTKKDYLAYLRTKIAEHETASRKDQ
jgi:hypothetical protein